MIGHIIQLGLPFDGVFPEGDPNADELEKLFKSWLAGFLRLGILLLS